MAFKGCKQLHGLAFRSFAKSGILGLEVVLILDKLGDVVLPFPLKRKQDPEGQLESVLHRPSGTESVGIPQLNRRNRTWERKKKTEDYGSFRDQETRIRVQFAVLKVVVHLDVAALSAPIYGTFWLIQNKTGFGYKVCPHLLFKWAHSASQNFYIHEFFQANTIVKGAEMRELCFSSPHREILGVKPLVKAAGMLSCLLVGKNWAL